MDPFSPPDPAKKVLKCLECSKEKPMGELGENEFMIILCSGYDYELNIPTTIAVTSCVDCEIELSSGVLESKYDISPWSMNDPHSPRELICDLEELKSYGPSHERFHEPMDTGEMTASLMALLD